MSLPAFCKHLPAFWTLYVHMSDVASVIALRIRDAHHYADFDAALAADVLAPAAEQFRAVSSARPNVL